MTIITYLHTDTSPFTLKPVILYLSDTFFDCASSSHLISCIFRNSLYILTTHTIPWQKKLFIAGLDYNVSDAQLGDLCAQFGTVESAKVVVDYDTGRSRGFGFVEMSTEEEAKLAMSSLHEQPFEGRTLMVNEAREKGASPHRNSNSGGYNNSNNSYGNRKESRGRTDFNRRAR